MALSPSADERIEGQTILDVMERLAALGYTGNLMAKEGGMVQCGTCSQRSPASEVAMERLARIEGASDPGAEVLVAGVMCPRCQARGALTLAYGPMASEVDAEVLARLQDMRHPTRPSEATPVPR
jgi:hypothetical protein